MQWGSVAEWVEIFVTGLVGVAVVVVAWWQIRNDEKARRDAHKAKLIGKSEVANSLFPEISLEMENIGPHRIIIRHIEMWVGNEQAKEGEYNAINSRKKSENLPSDYTFGFIKPPVILLNPEPSDVLEVGKSCIRLIPCNFDEKDALASLKGVVRNKKEAKIVQFKVCTDYGEFPVKSGKSVVDAITRAVTQKE